MGFKNFSEVQDKFDKFNQIKNYKKIFSTHEWISAYLETYDTYNNFVIRLDSGEYASFSKVNNQYCISGSPFNDFNDFQITKIDFKKLLNFKNQNKDAVIIIDCTDPIDHLKKYLVGQSYSCKVNLDTLGTKLSSRLRSMERKFKDDFVFREIGLGDIDFFCELEKLQTNRGINLNKNKLSEFNMSFEKKFDLFIKLFLKKIGLSEKIKLEVMYDKISGEAVARSLNFYFDNNAMGYLRSRDLSYKRRSSSIGFGLLLDLYFLRKMKSLDYKTYDYTRGTEPYKLRFGSEIYSQYKYVV